MPVSNRIICRTSHLFLRSVKNLITFFLQSYIFGVTRKNLHLRAPEFLKRKHLFKTKTLDLTFWPERDSYSNQRPLF